MIIVMLRYFGILLGDAGRTRWRNHVDGKDCGKRKPKENWLESLLGKTGGARVGSQGAVRAIQGINEHLARRLGLAGARVCGGLEYGLKRPIFGNERRKDAS